MSDIGTYFSVLKTIAAGNHKTSDIARALQIPVTAVPSKLQTLRELGFVERQVPVTEKNPEKAKKDCTILEIILLTFGSVLCFRCVAI